MIEKIIFKTTKRFPFSSDLLVLKRKEVSEGTVAVTRDFTLLYNPAFLSSIAEEEAQGVLLHEWFHIALRHFDLQNALAHVGLKYEPHICNIAGDLVINQILRSLGVKLPECALYPEKLSLPPMRTFTEYVRILIERGNCQHSEHVCAGNCGDIARGEGLDVDPITRSTLSERAKRGLAEVADILRRQGQGTFGIEEILGSSMLSKVPWRALLVRLLSSALSNKTVRTYAVPSRRDVAHIAKGKKKHGAKVAFILDTSGSMSDEDIKQAKREIIEIANRFAAVDLYLVTDKLYEVIKNVRGHMVPEKYSRGGTDLRPAIEEADRQNYDLLICFTDGYTDWPARIKHKMLVVLVVDTRVPDYCEKIVIRE
ncbi:MAG: hypothetical protein KatS3mg045_1923 [Bellilinea sp.]|nr:MAG: hypothetical protein KatS3mg045_1923 [Bellilinea sp.]